MDFEPNYEEYSVDDLLDVKKHINQQKYPERYEVVDLLLTEKLSDPTYKKILETNVEDNKYNTFGPRVIASIIDWTFLSVISFFLAYTGNHFGGSIQTAFGYIDTIQFVAYSITLHALAGQTIGKAFTNVMVLDCKTENKISTKQAFIRDFVPVILLFLSLIFSVFVLNEEINEAPTWVIYSLLAIASSYLIWHLLEIITMLFNDKNRALHDYIAGTVVVRT